MTQERPRVVAGIDAHTDTHQVAVLDLNGRLLAGAAFPTTRDGYAALIEWVGRQGENDRLGVESTGSFAAGLVRELSRQRLSVVEVNQPHPHARQRLGKSDPIDAELAARAVLSGSGRAAEGHERDRRGDPAAERHACERAQGSNRSPPPARRPGEHRARGAPCAAQEGEDAARQGKSRRAEQREIIRCLKRYIARETYYTPAG
jgi:hypothetical protein